MGLKEVKRLFFEIRKTCGIIVSKHAFEDYPERGFSQREVLQLIRNGTGSFEDNKSSEAIDGSYLFFPKDETGNECQLVILIEEIKIEGEDSKEGNQVIVCSAYRKVKL